MAFIPLTKPSVDMATHLTKLLPKCWATSKVRSICVVYPLDSNAQLLRYIYQVIDLVEIQCLLRPITCTTSPDFKIIILPWYICLIATNLKALPTISEISFALQLRELYYTIMSNQQSFHWHCWLAESIAVIVVPCSLALAPSASQEPGL